jgi:hypothetical protein
VPHSKGREASPFISCQAHSTLNVCFMQYIEILEKKHNVPEPRKLRGIDDPRNGIFLWTQIHKLFGFGHCAFLLVNALSLGP